MTVSAVFVRVLRHRLRFVWALALVTLFAVVAASPQRGAMRAQSPGPCDPPTGNAVVCENQLPGSPSSEWDIVGAGDGSIQGFATDISVNRGQTIGFKINTPAAAYVLDIYRMGYYGGMGARKVATIAPSAALPQTQPSCLTDAGTGLVDCGTWALSASWLVPSDATSGIYFARVTRPDTGGASHIVFIVRNDAGHSGLLFQTSDTTWQAYNQYGGNSLYVGGPGTNPGRAYKVSYNRPFTTRGTTPEDWVFNAEYPMVRWLEANGYDVSYSTGVDSDRNGALIQNHKVFLSVGHDEYWSGGQRAQVEAARAAGVHLAFFSGNEIFWKTRWEPTIAGDGTQYRTLVSYKETHANAKIDPQPNEWTGTWADPRFSPPADGGRPQNALSGTLFSVNCCSAAITVPAEDGRARFWRNTSVAALTPGTAATLPAGTLGYEWDSDASNVFRPAGLMQLSHTTVDASQVLLDYGSTYGAATAKHSLTLYRHSSGALVFGAGTVQWSWGLDSHHDRGSDAPSVAMQQATVNLFADMGVQPIGLQAGLVAATASSDTLAPSSTITFPPTGTKVLPNATVAISGLATDLGGGNVAGVEVSVDGGATWKPADGQANWSFTWHTGLPGTYTLLSRAVDDSGNLEQPVRSVAVVVGNYEVTGPGGPILVVTSAANPFTSYYAEILHAEGLNAFSVMDLSQVTATTLLQYDVVILGEMPLSDPQVTMLTAWVSAGGNLIAMRPDSKLASLLGLTGTGTTLAEAYLTVDTSTSPGAGIVGDSMQFHGTADRYALNGATAVATLYSTATAATTNPAVTIRNVGIAGGQAAAFAYDLARSIVFTRQGNPAWSGQSRDGDDPIRSDDLFFGGTVRDYVDLSKVAIPQADEQQRLLANLIGLMSSDRKPLPRFWYLPRGLKAAVVMTGDDHATGNTAGRFDILNAASAPGCSVADWECLRATSYMYPATPIAPQQVNGYRAQGFEISLHVRLTGPEACNNFTPASIFEDYTDQQAQFALLFGNTPLRTNRTHCIIWSDFDTQPQVAAAHGVRFDTNYYYWPAGWVKDVPGVFTGSAMPMRFAKADGTTIDVYQVATQMTDESEQTYPFTIDTLLDRALGSEGYYGAYVANMHTDIADHPGSAAIVASAQARGVPVVSAEQMLDWIDGRNGSTFDAIAWSGSALSFTVTQAAGANGLQAMVPSTVGTATLTGITRAGAPISYSIQMVKGVAYAMFASTSGAYVAQYSADSTPPSISSIAVTPSTQIASVTWTTNEAATSTVVFGTSPSALTSTVTSSLRTLAHAMPLTGLSPETTYYYRVASADVAGNSTTSPVEPAAPGMFTTTSFGCPCSVWTPGQTPAQPSAADPAGVEVGMRFRAINDGYITGIRFYKGATNTGPHVGNLWSNSGALIRTATFSGESASGWQQASLLEPVHITANTTYVVSYHTDSGNYAADHAYFQTTGVTRGPLQALANGVDGLNGVFRYGPSAFPTETTGAMNYWVDVVFQTSFVDTFPPFVTAVTPLAGATDAAIGTVVTATLNEGLNAGSISGSTVQLRDPSNALVAASVTYDAGTRTITLHPSSSLAYSTTYTARLTGGPGGVADLAGNPLAAAFTWSFTTAAQPMFGVTDTTVADFSAGTGNSGLHISETGNGELMLKPALAAEFSGTSLPSGWTTTPWHPGATAILDAGKLTIDGTRVWTDALLPAGQSLEFVATFSTDTLEHAGFAVTLDDPVWAIFSTNAGGGLWARTNDGVVPTDTLIPGSWLGAPHRYRIDWTSSSVVFFIDGTQVATHPVTIPANLRPIASDFNIGAGALAIDWMRLTPYATSAAFTSRVLDAGREVGWSTADWTAQVPSGTTLALSARFGNAAVPDATWTSWMPLASSGGPLSQLSRYVQYQATLTGDGANSPVLQDVSFKGPEAPPAPAVTLSINNVSVVEGNSGTTNAQFTVTLSGPSTRTIAVSYATADGSALSGSDYSATSGQLIFQPGTTSLQITVPVLTDGIYEPTETFTVALSNPFYATIANGQGVGTITDDDAAAPAITTQPSSITTSSGATASFAVAASGAPAPAYQWQASTDGGANWTTLTNGAMYQGATSDTLTVAGVPFVMAGVKYRAIATNVAGSAPSNAATLTLLTPIVTQAPDLNGDGKADLTVYNPATGMWNARYFGTSTGISRQWGIPLDVPVPGDYDGDGKADIAVFRPSTGNWFILRSSSNFTTIATYQWGTSGDIPVPGDYDGDHTTDLAIYRPSTGMWFILKSSKNFNEGAGFSWGVSGDIPVPGDYDGDGRTDLGLYRSSDAHWFIKLSTTNYTTWATYQWGAAGDVPVPGDYDGDHRTDLAIYRPSSGSWFILKSSTAYTAGAGYTWGADADIPVPGDFDGDGRMDIAVYRPSSGHWFIRWSSTNYATSSTHQWGAAGDLPIGWHP